MRHLENWRAGHQGFVLNLKEFSVTFDKLGAPGYKLWSTRAHRWIDFEIIEKVKTVLDEFANEIDEMQRDQIGHTFKFLEDLHLVDYL